MSRRQPHHFRAGGVLLSIAAGCALLSGCVFRQFTVTTSPPGAIVQVNGKTVGPTPVDVPFTYYGNYKLTIFREGYQTLVVNQPVPAPWYEWLPFEFVSENLLPWTIRDRRQFDFVLVPMHLSPAEDVLNKSQGLREQGKAAGVPLTNFTTSGMVPVPNPVPAGFETLPTPKPLLPTAP